jgi:hypothetical protein
MTTSLHPELDLTVSRIMEAPRSAVWNAWTDPASFEQWWVPAPAIACSAAMRSCSYSLVASSKPSSCSITFSSS